MSRKLSNIALLGWIVGWGGDGAGEGKLNQLIKKLIN